MNSQTTARTAEHVWVVERLSGEGVWHPVTPCLTEIGANVQMENILTEYGTTYTLRIRKYFREES